MKDVDLYGKVRHAARIAILPHHVHAPVGTWRTPILFALFLRSSQSRLTMPQGTTLSGVQERSRGGRRRGLFLQRGRQELARSRIGPASPDRFRS
jgi:hypothetical protein